MNPHGLTGWIPREAHTNNPSHSLAGKTLPLGIGHARNPPI